MVLAQLNQANTCKMVLQMIVLRSKSTTTKCERWHTVAKRVMLAGEDSMFHFKSGY